MTEAIIRADKLEFTPDQVELIKKTIMPPFKMKERGEWIEKPATDDELRLFLYVAKEKNLNPLLRELYAIRNRDGKLTFMTSIDGLRIQAERSKVYAGQLGPFWCGSDGVWKDVWLSDEYPVAAKVGILRHGFKEPVWGVAKFKAYAQWKDEWVDGRPTGKKTLIGFWAKGDEHMIAKISEACGLRKAFPTQMGESGASALYIAEEAHAIAGEERGSKEAAAAVAAEKVRQHEEKKALEAPKPPAAVVPEFQPLPPIEAPVEQPGVAVGPDGEFVLPDEPEDTSCPIIEDVKQVKTKKEQPMLFVKWAGVEWGCFDKDLFEHIEKGKGQRAVFVTTEQGKYKNIVGIKQIGSTEFDSDGKTPCIQRGLL